MSSKVYVYDWLDFQIDKRKIAAKFRKSAWKFKNIYGIPRGGLVLAVNLSHLCDLPLIIDKKDITKDTIIVDEIADTGKTLCQYSENFTITIYKHPQSCFEPNIWIRKKGNLWIIFPWEV